MCRSQISCSFSLRGSDSGTMAKRTDMADMSTKDRVAAVIGGSLHASALSARACMWVMREREREKRELNSVHAANRADGMQWIVHVRGTMFLSALLLMTFVAASSISLMIAVGPCVFSCGTRVKRTLLPACCSSLIGSMRL